MLFLKKRLIFLALRASSEPGFQGLFKTHHSANAVRSAPEQHFSIYRLKRSLLTVLPRWSRAESCVCAPLTNGGWLKDRYNASSPRIAVQSSGCMELFSFCYPVRPLPNCIRDYACCASVFRPIIRQKHNLEPMWSPLR